MRNKILLLGITVVSCVLLIIGIASIKQMDVIGNGSVASFKAVLNEIPDAIGENSLHNGWSLTAPDESATFIWANFSKGPIYNAMFEFDAQPFIDAGLDISKLPEGMAYDHKMIVGTKFGEGILNDSGEITPFSSFEQIVTLIRENIGYHAAMDHYGIDLEGGNMFEWAKDMGNNDKDIVFALNPQPLIDAGVDPAKVEGWTLAKVETMDSTGKVIEVEKLLKPFNLK